MTRLASLFTLLFVLTIGAHAQLEEAKDAYNSGVEAAQNDNLEEAIMNFYDALDYLDAYGMEDEQALSIRTNIESRLPGLNLQLATDYAKADKNDKAIQTLETAIELGNDYGDEETVDKAQSVLAQLYYLNAVRFYKQSDFDHALGELEEAIKADSSYVKANYLEVVIYKAQENDAALEETAKKAMEIEGDEETVDKIKDLAHTYFLKKGNDAKGSAEYGEAIQYLNKAIAFNEENSLSYLLLLQCYSSQEKWSKVIETADDALSYLSDDEKQAAVYFELGKAYAGEGDTQEACKAYSNAAVGKYKANADYQMEHVLKCN